MTERGHLYAAADGLRPAKTPPFTGSVVPVIQPAFSPAKEQDGLDDVFGLPVPPQRVEGINGDSTARACSDVINRS